MDEEIFLRNTYHVNVIRTDLTRAIPALILELVDEAAVAFEDTFKLSGDSGAFLHKHLSDTSSPHPLHADSIALPVFSTMTHLIARISNRALLGKDMCRSKAYTDAMVRFAESVVGYSYALRPCPVILRE